MQSYFISRVDGSKSYKIYASNSTCVAQVDCRKAAISYLLDAFEHSDCKQFGIRRTCSASSFIVIFY